MKNIVCSLVLICGSLPAFADLVCTLDFQGAPTELAQRALPSLPYRYVQIDNMGKGQIQIDIQNNYDQTRTVRLLETVLPTHQLLSIGGIALGDYKTSSAVNFGSPDDLSSATSISITPAGRILLKDAGTVYACEIPGTYKNSYLDDVIAGTSSK